MFFAGKRATQSYLFNTGFSPYIIKPTLLSNLIQQYGGVESDYDLYWVENNSVIATRVSNLDSFALTWAENTYYDDRPAWKVSGVWVTESNPYPIGIGPQPVDYIWEITGVDFSTEDNKKIIYMYSDKTEIMSDGVDEALISLEIWNSDKTICTNCNEDVLIPITGPTSRGNIRFQISGGRGSKILKSREMGEWIIPNIPRVGNLNVSSSGVIRIQSLFFEG